MPTIAELNDAFRKGAWLDRRNRVLFTQGVAALDQRSLVSLMQAVRGFNQFDHDNDPHGEHDFGRVKIGQEEYYFKIDYYNNDLDGGSEDPSDPETTIRVMTIMRTDEY